MRYSSLGYGAALGLMAVSTVGLCLSVMHRSPNWWALACLFGACLGLVPSLEAAIDLARLARSDANSASAELLRQREWAARLAAGPRTVALPTLSTAEQAANVRDHHWRVMAHRFVTAGDLYGFGIRVLALAGSPHKVISWGGWGEMTHVLRDAGVLVGSGDGTRWASPEWGMERWQAEKDRLPLPHMDKEPPDVVVTVRGATQQRATTGETPAARAVVDG